MTQEIGQRLRSARQSKALSLNALSALTGGAVSTSRLNNYEWGIRCLGIEAARSLANALGTCTRVYLLCIDDLTTLTPDELDLPENYRATDAEGLALVRENTNEQVRRAEQDEAQ